MYKLIPGCKFQECDESGRFRSIDHETPTRSGYMKHYPGKPLKTTPDAQGYHVISLTRGEVRRTYKAHRIVWETHVGPIPPEMTIDHIDEDKDNNALSNLQLMHAGDNAAKSAVNQRGKKRRYIARDHGPAMKEMHASGKTIREIAEHFDCSGSLVDKVLRGIRGVSQPRKQTQASEILLLESQGKLYSEIAAMLSLEPVVVSQICAQNRKSRKVRT